LFFECYPERRIPVSEEGQNLQLLLPPASRSECGFIEEELHTYRKRSDGHSGKKRSFTETMHRIKNFTALKTEILEYCDCDKAYYKQETLKLEEERRNALLLSAASKARGDMKR